jgi:hypothetical protein
MKLRLMLTIVSVFLAAGLAACANLAFAPLSSPKPMGPEPWHRAGCSASSSVSLSRGQYPSTPTPAQKDALCE